MKGDIKPIEFMARRRDWNFGISLYARQVTEGVGFAVAMPLVMESVAVPGSNANPFAVIGIDEAQNLMDELWECGIRPTEGTGSAGSLAATQRHLEDMQKIAMLFVNKAIGKKA